MSYLKRLKDRRGSILLGEIGALLHDIGKLHPDFIRKNSIESDIEEFYHANIDAFVNPELISLIKSKLLEFKINGHNSNIYRLITEHHDKQKKDDILEFLKICDRKDSADDKGIVRKKQSVKNTLICSPFGYPKEKIELSCLQKHFEKLETQLINLLKNYLSGRINVVLFRRELIESLKVPFSHALGETRIPANDVTLWDHSYSTASLFKTILATIVLGDKPDNKNPAWRIFGICWNGIDFVNKGRKIAEIQERSRILKEIKNEIKEFFEEEFPLGNAIYEDINGIYFTFPELKDKSENLAKECAKKVLNLIYKESQNELWPFFTLSKASSSLTIIADELKLASAKRKIPKMTPILIVEGEEKIWFDSSEISIPAEGQDICPICRLRPKDVKKERCNICEERRSGRLLQWLLNREKTVWIDEVTDKNNRIALISLSFYLDKWLDGTMVGTIYSQTFEDWKRGKRFWRKAVQNIIKDKKIKQTGSLKEDAYEIAIWIARNLGKTEVNPLLESYMEDGSIDNVPEEIKKDSGAIVVYFFTQNPSPARLYRIWRETEEFFDLIIREIKNEIYHNKWKRIKFHINYDILQQKLKQGSIDERASFVIQINKLEPQNLLVFHDKKGEFYTIESLEKFKYKSKTAEEAVKEALKEGFRHIAPEDNPSENLLNPAQEIEGEQIKLALEEYYPLIELNKSPLSLRFVVPALDSLKIIELIVNLYNERFRKVIGKLPLNIKLLVTKRKFPLYILLDAENRMLKGKDFEKQIQMRPWWDLIGIKNDKYYSQYPVRKMEEGKKYTLDDLSPLSKGKHFWLYPGYFDFDLLLGTADRYNIYYEEGRRKGKYYKLLTGRPYFFYQISQILELWDELATLSGSQINFIEESLKLKLKEWKEVKDNDKMTVFRKFAEAVLKDAFGEEKWQELGEERKAFIIKSALNGVLLDAITLFRHVIKEEVSKNE